MLYFYVDKLKLTKCAGLLALLIVCALQFILDVCIKTDAKFYFSQSIRITLTTDKCTCLCRRTKYTHHSVIT